MYKSEHIITLKHYLFWITLAFALGIFIFSVIDIASQILLFIFLFSLIFSILLVFVIIPFARRKPITLRKSVLLPLTLIIFFILGMLRPLCTEVFSFRTLRNYAGKDVRLFGYVDSSPNLSDNGYFYSFNFDIKFVEYAGETVPVNGKILMNINEDMGKNLKFSQYIECWASISPEGDLTLDDDLFTYIRSKNIFLTGKTKSFTPATPKRISHSPVFYIKHAGVRLHNLVSDAIDALFSYSDNDKFLLKGILLGDKSEMSDDFLQKLSNAGISHVSAVSGMHMSILFSSVTYLLFFIRLKKKYVLLLSLPLIILFASTAAFTPSVCRSAIMLTLMILASLSREPYTPIISLSFSALIILLFSPYALFSKGFLLSCFAVLGIIMFAKYLKKLLYARNSIFSLITDSLSVSLSSAIGTTYFTILFFDSVSLIQVLTNIWVIPLVTIVFCSSYPLCFIYYILPESFVLLLRYPVVGALRLISMTTEVFGSDIFSLKINSASLPLYFHAIYLCFVIILYFLLKLLYDYKKDRLNKKYGYFSQPYNYWQY